MECPLCRTALTELSLSREDITQIKQLAEERHLEQLEEEYRDLLNQEYHELIHALLYAIDPTTVDYIVERIGSLDIDTVT